MAPAQPPEEYRQRLASRQRAYARSLQLDARISYGRLTAVGTAAAVAILGYRGLLTWWWMTLPASGFVALLVWHDRVIRVEQALARAVDFYERGIARLEDRWIDDPASTEQDSPYGRRFLDDDHLYARDLDIFGHGSLFHLLSLARTHAGEDTLAGWLKAPAATLDLRRRQEAVAELRDRLDFREALATTGGEAGDIETTALTSWGSASPISITTSARAAAVALAIAIVTTAAWWFAGGPAAPLVLALLLKAAFARAFQQRVALVTHGSERPLRQLDVLAGILALIEQEPVTSPRLAQCRTVLTTGRLLPSAAIQRLHRLSELLEWERNIIFAPIAALGSWSVHVAAAIESWRREFGRRVPGWLAIAGEYEALSSLAAYAYEHPSDPFPIVTDDLENADGPAVFEGARLGHPLVPASRMVRNDVVLAREVRMLIVSGSNMSGKSTLLRTVGINTVLAMAGAPVRAERLTLSPLAAGATLHIQDSLQAGRSRFFAEITRIRRISDLAAGKQPRLMFLLDEILQGTNSHDRRIGAAAMVRNLVDRGAIGLITTHDLALTAIADETGGRAVNVHFDDEFREGQLVFDYRLKPGPVTRSNALELMRAVGLLSDT
jgi:MutS domain V